MINSTYLPMVFPKINEVEPRVVTGYSIILFFVDEVSMAVNLWYVNQLYTLSPLPYFPSVN
jgi:hypothetical protein